jgi:hypothetical protein
MAQEIHGGLTVYCRLIQRADGVPNRNFLDWLSDPLNFEERRILERNRLKAEAAAREESQRLERDERDRQREIQAKEQLEREREDAEKRRRLDRESAEREQREWIEKCEREKRQWQSEEFDRREAARTRQWIEKCTHERVKLQLQRDAQDQHARCERERGERARQAQIAAQPPEQPVNPLGDFLGAFEADAAWVVTNGGEKTKVISRG